MPATSLTAFHVRLGATARTPQESIRAVGEVLVAANCIEPGYISSMLSREAQANTYLGRGIAIPHGQPQDRGLIRQTGVAVMQFPSGIEWRADQTVYVVVGIAARSDEHLDLLAALTDVLDDPESARRIATTTDVSVIMRALRREPSVPLISPAEDDLWGDGLTMEAGLPTGVSLHARPAAALVEIASSFSAEIRVRYGEKSANGKSMAALLKLGASSGARLTLAARGKDADSALIALRSAIAAGLGDKPETATIEKTGVTAWTPLSPLASINGVSASPGLVIGRIHRYEPDRIAVTAAAPLRSVEEEQLVFARALATALEQMKARQRAATSAGNSVQAAIFQAHQGLLSDTELRSVVSAQIAKGKSAAWAWQQAIETQVSEIAKIQDERLAGRAADVRDVGQFVMSAILGLDPKEIALPDEPAILIADDLAPSDTAQLNPKIVLGLCTAAGGPTSHTAIIARSLDIPAIVSAGKALAAAQTGVIAILDGISGRLYLDPDEANLAAATSFRDEMARHRATDDDARYQPALMSDGHRIEVVANIGKVSEAAAAVEAGAEGVGLLRTEFLFLDRTTAPSEDEQFESYSKMATALGGLPLIIRTLDIGGDKVLPYLPLPKEDNPFLGVRGIRLCLRYPELFRAQLRAIYRAAAVGSIKMMFPMIATVEDFRNAQSFAESVRRELNAPSVPMGIMVEVPSAVVLAPELAREVDFFSIGTNDLTQYALAIDRLHPVLGNQADALHPAVLRLIDQTVRAARNAGKWVGVCGGLAGDARGAIILAGLGVTELSMSSPSIGRIKAQLRRIALAQAKSIAQEAQACSTVAEVRSINIPA